MLTALGSPLAAVANVAPVVDAFAATPAAVLPGGTVAISLQAHDPDCPSSCSTGCGLVIDRNTLAWSDSSGRPVAAAFSASDPGPSGSPWSATVTWNAPATEGSYTIAADFADNGGMMCGGRKATRAELTVVVSLNPNQPPVIATLVAAPQSVFPGATTTVYATVSDPDGDPVALAWSAATGTVTPQSPTTASFVAPATPGGTVVTCTASDGRGGTAAKSVTVGVSEVQLERSINAGLRAPSRVALNSAGEAFVLDPSLGGLVILGLFAQSTPEVWAASDARGVAVDWLDRIVLARGSLGQVLTRDGSTVLTLTPPTPLGAAGDVAVDAAGHRYALLFPAAGRTVVFDDQGRALFSFGATGDGAGEFRTAPGVAFTPAGEIAVTDNGHGLVQFFSASNGAFIRAAGGIGSGLGQFTQANGIAVRPTGTVFVSDSFQSAIQAFSATGTPRESFGEFGTGQGQFRNPAGLAVSETFKRLVVASVNTSRLEVFRLSGLDAAQPMLALSTTSLDFGQQLVGMPGAPRTVILTSAGTAPVTVVSLAPSGDFSLVAATCGAALAPGQSCRATLAFTPGAAGPRTGTLRVTSNASAGGDRVDLRGVGVAPALPATAVDPATVDFGSQPLRTATLARTVTISNVGGVAVDLGTLQPTGAAAGDFAVTGACVGLTLQPQGQCTLQIVFTPSATGRRDGAVAVPAAPAPLTLVGTGAALEAIPTLDELGLLALALALVAAGLVALARRSA